MWSINCGEKAVLNIPKNFDWKKIGFISVLVYVMSLPIMLWRSSKIGKVLYIILILTLVVKASTYAVDKLSTAYFNISGVFETRKSIDPMVKEINEINRDLINQRKSIRKLEEDISNKIINYTAASNKEIEKEKNSILEELKSISEYSKVLKDAERDALKKSITEMIEQVKLKGRSIDEAEIRNRLETILESKNLLMDDEKKRFFTYLEGIGFRIKKIEDRAIRVYSNTYSVTSADAMSTFRYDRFDDEE